MADEKLPQAERRPVAWRAIATMAMLAAWTLFIIVYALLWAPAYSLFQSIVVLVGSLILTAIAIGTMWMAYGIRRGFAS